MLLRTVLITLVLTGPALADLTWAQDAGPSNMASPTAPDRPGTASQQQLQSEVAALREKIAAVGANIDARLLEKDKAIQILQDFTQKEPSPSNVQLNVDKLEALFNQYQEASQKERDAIRVLLEAKIAELDQSNASQDELGEARYRATQEAIVLARENADKALTTALTGQKELLSAALATANEQVGRVEKTNAERFAAVNTALDRLLAERGELPNKREIEIQFTAQDSRFLDRVKTTDGKFSEIDSRLARMEAAQERVAGKEEGVGGFWAVAATIIGIAIAGAMLMIAMMNRPRDVHYVEPNGRARS